MVKWNWMSLVEKNKKEFILKITFYFILGNQCLSWALSVTNYGWHRLESNWGRRSVARTVGGRSVVSNIKFVTHKQLAQCALLRYWLTVWSPGDGLSAAQTRDTDLQLRAIMTETDRKRWFKTGFLYQYVSRGNVIIVFIMCLKLSGPPVWLFVPLIGRCLSLLSSDLLCTAITGT